MELPSTFLISRPTPEGSCQQRLGVAFTATERALDPALDTGEPTEVDAVVEEVRRLGYARTSGGVIPGIASVAAPVLTTGDSLPLVVALALPERAASEDVLRDVTAALLEATAVMSAELGVA